MADTLEFKRGATFRLPFQITEDDGETPVDTTGWTVTCHVRDKSGDTLRAETVVTAVDESTGSYEALVTDTSAWPLGAMITDVRAVDGDDDIHISGTLEFPVVREATRS